MGKEPKGPPVLSLSASADATTPGQTAKLASPPPPPVTVEDIEEFQDELRRQKQANNAQLILQAFVIGGLIFRWFRDRRKGRKPKAPRTPPSSDS
jgi:hypothetical protein